MCLLRGRTKFLSTFLSKFGLQRTEITEVKVHTTVKSIDILFFSRLSELFRSFDYLFYHCIFMVQSSDKFVTVFD
jgi:hypothetical protein